MMITDFAPAFNVPIAIVQVLGTLLLLIFLAASVGIISRGYVNWRYMLPADLWAVNEVLFLTVAVWRKVTGSVVPDALFMNNWSTLVQMQAIITLTGITVLTLWAYRKQGKT